MTILVHLSPETERKLVQRAESAGKQASELASELIEIGIGVKPTLDEILAPFRSEVAACGLSEDQLAELFEKTREEAFQAKQAGLP